MAVGTILVACLAIFLVGLSGSLPGGYVAGPGNLQAEAAPIQISVLAVVLTCLGMAIGGITVSVAALEPGGLTSRLPAVLVALMLVGIGGMVLITWRAASIFNQTLASAYLTVGVVAIVCALGLVMALFTPARRWRWLAPGFASIPFLALLLVFVAGSYDTRPIGDELNAAYPDYPDVLSMAGIIGAPVVFMVGIATSLLVLVTFWQTTTWSKASAQQLGIRVARVAERSWWLLPAILGASLIWLVAGVAGRLPLPLGGSSDVWRSIRHDTLPAWLYAAALTAAVTWWLMRGDRTTRFNSRPIDRYAAWAVVAFTAVTMAIGIHETFAPLVGAVGPLVPVPEGQPISACITDSLPQGASAFTRCLASFVSAQQTVWLFAVTTAALLIGIVLVRRDRSNLGALFLVLLGAWSLPRAYTSMVATVGGDSVLHGLPRFDAPQPETFGATITIMVAALAFLWWSGHQRMVGPGPLTIILVVTGVLLHGNTLLPTAPIGWLLSLVIIFPVLYELSFDSEGLNEPSGEQISRLLSSVGLRAVIIVILLAAVSIDLGELTSGIDRQVAFVLLAPPFAAIIVATVIHPMLVASTERRSTGPARWLLAAAGGTVALLVVAAVSLAIEPSLRPFYASASDRFSGLETHVANVRSTVAGSTSPQAKMAFWRSEVKWLSTNPPHDCAVEAWRAWDAYVDDVRQMALVQTGIENLPAIVDQGTVAMIRVNQIVVTQRMAGDLDTYERRLDVAKTACVGV